jgi:hypothetical protein
MSNPSGLPSQPPPLPPRFPPGGSPIKQRRQGFFVQAAKASWRAPFIAILLGFCTFTMRDKDRTVAMIIGSANGLIICLGMLLAITALYGAFVRHVKGIITPAIIGLIINSLLVFSFYSVMSSSRRMAETMRQQARQNALDDMERQGRETAEKYPGWLGFGRLASNTVIGVTQLNDDAPMAGEMKSWFGTRCSLMNVAVDNSLGAGPVNIDQDSIELHFSNGRVLKAINTRSVFNTAREDRDKWLQKSGMRVTPPHAKLTDGVAFLPDRTDLTDLAEVVISVNGEPIAIPGHYYSVQEKAELLERAKQAQSPGNR